MTKFATMWVTAAALAMAGMQTSPAQAAAPDPATGMLSAAEAPTATPIKHLVVIYDENESFDHYFGTYPKAANPPGEPPFHAAPGTPWASTLESGHLLTNNPNLTNPENGKGAANPFRIDRSDAWTADQDHGYTAEQRAYDHGKADLFPKYTGAPTKGRAGPAGTTGQVMGYFDGNTVTALWNYAQHFAMSDNAHGNTYGPSTPGAIEVVSGQTNGVRVVKGAKSDRVKGDVVYNESAAATIIDDPDPAYDVCSTSAVQVVMEGPNIGDLLNAAGIPWGGFMGGFELAKTNRNGSTGCDRSHRITVGPRKPVHDYLTHHNWFQFFASTSNPAHAMPQSLAAVGHSFDPSGTRDPANHEYGLSEFYQAVASGNFPAVSYIKLPAYEDGHPGYSDSLDEQRGVVDLVNFIERQPAWKSTAIIVTYDDSDGWYDSGFVAPIYASYSDADELDGPGKCGFGRPPLGLDGRPVNGRCGLGPRLPFLVISPWARPNFIAHDEVDQASVLRFVEDNWLLGKRLGKGSFDASAGSIMDMFDFTSTGGHTPPVFLNPETGEIAPR